MHLESINWPRIENFIGFGSPGARVLFIGLEEGLLDGTDLAEDLQARSSYEPYMDLWEAQRDLKDCTKYFGANAVCQRTWRPMCHLMLRRRGVLRPTKHERAVYQAMKLGRRDGDTLLAELLPYPSHDKGAWPYERLGRFDTREAYERRMLPYRIKLLRQVMAHDVRPEIVVCYGKVHWPEFEQLFDGVTWADADAFRMGVYMGATVVLAPHLSGRAFNTESQLDQFADIALSRHRVPPVGTTTDEKPSRSITDEDRRRLFPEIIRDDFREGGEPGFTLRENPN